VGDGDGRRNRNDHHPDDQVQSASNANVHFHMLYLDGVYIETKYGKTRFQRTNAPEQQELVELVHTISHRVAGFLEREGILERDEDDCMEAGGRAAQEAKAENSYVNLEGGRPDAIGIGLLGQLSHCHRTAARPQGIHAADHPGPGR
jgi:hypothetical protein